MNFKNEKSVSVVIPSFNGKHLLSRNLNSIKSSLENACNNYEIIVVDDCSSDGTPEFLNQEYPYVKTYRNSVNSGFGESVNIGVEISQYELVLLLNNDISLPDEYFSKQFDYFLDEDTFGVCARICSYNNDIQEAGWYPYFEGDKLKWKSFNFTNESKTFTLYLCGGNALIDRKKFLELGGFSSLFHPFYMEDVELSLRAWRKGYKCYYEPSVACFHEKSSTIEKYFKKEFIKISSKKNYTFIHLIHGSNYILNSWKLKLAFYRFWFFINPLNSWQKESFYLTLKNLKKALKLRKQFENFYQLDDVVNEIQENIKKAAASLE